MQLAAPVLIVSPHPDDETLACGGLIALMTGAGRRVVVVIVTDGAGSHSGSREWPPEKLAALRAQEAHAALDVLGVARDARMLWGIADGDVPRPGQPGYDILVDRAAAFVAHADARTIVLPWRRDPHPDHAAVSALFRAAAPRMPVTPEILEYTIWADIRPQNARKPGAREAEQLSLDISPVLRRKSAAIDQYRSQRGLVVNDVRSGFSLEGRVRGLFEQQHEIYWRTRSP